jgi:rRNA maturation endonuclease Nob1
MNIHVKGKIVLDGIDCQHCNHKVLNGSLEETEICESCGARYKLVNVNINNNEPNSEYAFTGFNCIERGWLDKCHNTCPAPFMYCKYHSDDASIEKAKKAIDEAKCKVVEAEERLKVVEESKKTWMVTELSGINDE